MPLPFLLDHDDDDDEERPGAKDPMPSSIQIKLLEARKVIIAEPIEARTAHRVMAELLYLQVMDPTAPVDIYINSPGGEISSGLAIYDCLRHMGFPLRTVAAGLTASIATIIYVAAPRPSRCSLPNTRFLIHQPLAGFKGCASDLEIHANEIVRTKRHVNGILADATGQSMEKIDRDTNRDYWMTAEEALEYGLVGEILGPGRN